MRAVDDWCLGQRIDCAYLLAEVDDQVTCDMAHAHGFRLVDVRVTLEADDSPVPSRPTIAPLVRPARGDDVESLMAIARDNHRHTRFYADGRFDPRRCDDLYAFWISESCRGRADRVFVIDINGSPAGYLTCHLDGKTGHIGLVAVAAAYRGRGAGLALVESARRWFAEQGADRVTVVTQARNAAGLKLYQRAGMTVRLIQLWFHKWW
jgi:dTDP-4-amino-4,6-dideoxy-D-galactose acyltransferase